MLLLDIQRGCVALHPRGREAAVRQVGSPDFRARQVVDVLEVQLVPAVVEHVYHLVRQDALDESVDAFQVLAHHNLVGFGVVAAAHDGTARLAGDVAANVNFTT